MLGKRAAQYFKNRTQNDPQLKSRHHYYRLMLSIANHLQSMRKAEGLTQKELAKLLNTSQSTIALWETPGYTGYSLSKLHQFADKLDYNLAIDFNPKATKLPMLSEQVKGGWYHVEPIRIAADWNEPIQKPVQVEIDQRSGSENQYNIFPQARKERVND